MTPEEIDQLEAGRELDCLIAVHVMGWKQNSYAPSIMDEGGAWFNAEGRVEHLHETCFSTDIAAAWLAVQKLESQGMFIIFSNSGKDGNPREISMRLNVAGFYKMEPLPVAHLKRIAEAKALTAPLAICRAALKTVMNGE